MSQKILDAVSDLCENVHETRNLWDKKHGEILDRVESLESRGIRVASTTDLPPETKARKEWRKYLRAFCTGKTSESEITLSTKAVTVASATGGGNAVEEDISRRIQREMLNISPVRQLVGGGERTSALSDYKKLVITDSVGTGWAAEATSRAETSTPTFQSVAPTNGENYAVLKLSNWSVQDSFFDIEQWLVDEGARQMAKAEGSAFVNGDGTNKPTGFVTTSTPVSTSDDASPARAFGVVQYIASGAAGAFTNDRTGSPGADPLDAFIDMLTSLRAEHQANSVWGMSSATLGTMLKFTDANGNRLIGQSGEAAPMTLLGRPISIISDMPAVAANSFSVVLADWPQFYVVVDSSDMQLIRDQFTDRGNTLLYLSRRTGGDVTNSSAGKLMKMAAT